VHAGPDGQLAQYLGRQRPGAAPGIDAIGPGAQGQSRLAALAVAAQDLDRRIGRRGRDLT
jgi:hypothetical protein